LTNASSRKTRQEIFHSAISILNMDFQTMIYQEQMEDQPYQEMTIHSYAQFMTSILGTNADRQALLTHNPLPNIKTIPFHPLITHMRHKRIPVTPLSFTKKNLTLPPPQNKKGTHIRHIRSRRPYPFPLFNKTFQQPLTFPYNNPSVHWCKLRNHCRRSYYITTSPLHHKIHFVSHPLRSFHIQ
jgi:hypothetical protein